MVPADEPPRLEASWSGSQEEAWSSAVAGEHLPPLTLAHLRGSRALPMPHASDLGMLKQCLHLKVREGSTFIML